MDRNLTAEQADDAQYAALAAELAEPDPDLPDFSPAAGGEATPDAGEYGEARQAPDEDAERNERITAAAAQADQLQDQFEAWQQQQQRGPSLEENPIGYFQHQLAIRDQADAERRHNAFWRAVEITEQQMRQTTPDYDDACKHLEGVRMAQLELTYPDDDPRAHMAARQLGLGSPAQLRTAILANDAAQVAQMAAARGRNPAQMYYDLAVKSGFRSGSQTMEAARRGQRATGNYARSEQRRGRVMSEKQLTDLYTDDPEAFDREWERYAAAQR